MNGFINWFTAHGGVIDEESVGLTSFPGQGCGAVALKDIPEDHTLFRIPRDLVLSTRTSTLPGLIGQHTWRQLELHKGWVGVILCMMWEDAQGASSEWSEYLATMPSTFNTLMFWSPEELQELKGTTVVDKIGKEDVERDYFDRLLPALETRQDLFPPSQIPTYYSLENYHKMGSRILSRSFHVEQADEQGNEGPNLQQEDQNLMDLDPVAGDNVPDDDQVHELDRELELIAGDDSDDDSDAEDPADVAMVPMADMLNARYGCENAKLFYEQRYLGMVSTKPIAAGEQIWNTYGNPPNSDLLRRYGHVDIVPLTEGGEGNPADIVEIRADLVVESVVTLLRTKRQQSTPKTEVDFKERIEWWLDEGCDDVFDITMDYAVPGDMISFVKLLLLNDEDWLAAMDKGRPPKGKLDAEVLSYLLAFLEARLQLYPSNLAADESLLQMHDAGTSILPDRKHQALVVRTGEQRILAKAIRGLEHIRQSTLLTSNGKDQRKDKKRSQHEADQGQSSSRAGKRKK